MMLALHLLRLRIKLQSSSPGTFLVNRLAQLLAYLCTFAAVWIILSRFGSVGGWQPAEVTLLLGFQLLCYGLGASISFTQMRDLESAIRSGELDLLFTKPAPVWLYFSVSRYSTGYASHIVLAIATIIYSITLQGYAFDAGHCLLLIAAALNGAVIVASIFVCFGVLSIIRVDTRSLFSLIAIAFDASRYPLPIYLLPLQVALLVLPVGFAGYVPVALLLGKDVALLGDWALPATILAGPAALAAAFAMWKVCLRLYMRGVD